MKKVNDVNKGNTAKKLSMRLNEISKALTYKMDEIKNFHSQNLITKEKLSLVTIAWNTKECKDIYNRFIKLASSFKIVKFSMRDLARQMAINCYIENVEPDLEDFKNKVIIASDN